MSTTTEHVHEILDRDVFLQEVLARDVVRLRALARWLQSNHGVEGNVGAIVSAIQRYEQPAGGGSLDEARSLLEQMRVQADPGKTVLVVQRNAKTRKRLDKVLEHVDVSAGHTLRVVPADRTMTIVVDDHNAPAVEDELGVALVKETVEDLVDLVIEAPKEGVDTPGVLGIAFSALSLRGINVPFMMSGYPQQFLMVDEEDYVEALNVLTGLSD